MAYYFKKQYQPKFISNTFKNILDDLLDNDEFKSLDDYPVQANVISKEKETVIELLTPDIPKEDINIDCQADKLIVSYQSPKEESIEGKYTQQQIFKDGFKNTFKISSELDQEKISAKMNNGILEIKIPRKKEKSKTRIKITWHLIDFRL